MDAHGQRWNLRKFACFSIQKVAHPSGINLQLAAETGEFSQVPSLSMGIHAFIPAHILDVFEIETMFRGTDIYSYSV